MRFTVSCLGQVSSWEMLLWEGEYRTPGLESPTLGSSRVTAGYFLGL